MSSIVLFVLLAGFELFPYETKHFFGGIPAYRSHQLWILRIADCPYQPGWTGFPRKGCFQS